MLVVFGAMAATAVSTRPSIVQLRQTPTKGKDVSALSVPERPAESAPDPAVFRREAQEIQQRLINAVGIKDIPNDKKELAAALDASIAFFERNGVVTPTGATASRDPVVLFLQQLKGTKDLLANDKVLNIFLDIIRPGISCTFDTLVCKMFPDWKPEAIENPIETMKNALAALTAVAGPIEKVQELKDRPKDPKWRKKFSQGLTAGCKELKSLRKFLSAYTDPLVRAVEALTGRQLTEKNPIQNLVMLFKAFDGKAADAPIGLQPSTLVDRLQSVKDYLERNIAKSTTPSPS